MKDTTKRNALGILGAAAGAALAFFVWVLLYPYGQVLSYIAILPGLVASLFLFRLCSGGTANRMFFLCPAFTWLMTVFAVYYTVVKDIQALLQSTFSQALHFSLQLFDFQSGNAQTFWRFMLTLLICLLLAAALSFLIWLFWPEHKQHAD